jgi:3-hydroxyisobutyrate dehydrogenase
MTSALRVGFVGLGHMGRPMAGRLADAGFTLAVFDARSAAVESFVERYPRVRATAALGPLARASDVVITMLPNGQAVRQVVLGAGGPRGASATDQPDGGETAGRLIDALAPGSILADMGSSSPVGTRELGEVLAERGVTMLDAPVSGGVKRAETGKLAIMVGGDAPAIERCRPLFAALGEQVFATGPLGAGHALKALNNLVSAAGLIASAEALLIGRRFGLDPALMVDVFNASTARNNSTENKMKQYVLSETYASGFSLELMVKDLTTAIELAQHTETPSPFSATCRELWAAARSELEDDADHTAVVRWFERLARTKLKGSP